MDNTLMNVRTRSLVLTSLLVLALALFAVGCGDDDESDTASVSTTTVTEAHATDAADDDAAEGEEAEGEDAEGEEATKALQDEVIARSKTSDKSEAKPTEESGAYGYGGATHCGAGVYVRTSNTSCAFALNVASDFYSSPGYRFYSYSPVTGQTYLVRCTKTWPSLCRAGNGARILITQ